MKFLSQILYNSKNNLFPDKRELCLPFLSYPHKKPMHIKKEKKIGPQTKSKLM